MPSKLKLESTPVVETVAAKATGSEVQIEADDNLTKPWRTRSRLSLRKNSPPNMNASLGWPIRTGKSAVARKALPSRIGS